ncbi:MAG: TonB-dependent hemoglobin/transferrin/lactoferrin family receptor [Betaproteobacteria bacterium]|nr:TonB-dependent hemoglobin/transferrin/lactoferrin family receptor [Betaproteobacteria bacterium]
MAEADTPTLRNVVVTATRVETEADKVPATVTIIGRKEIDTRLPADEADLFKDEPDMVFSRDLRRFGATRPNIRGIEDTRVIQMVDGVRLPDFRDGGGPTNFTMSAPPSASLEFLKRVEILRGPASSLYGSDAIGGVVGYLTLDPADLLQGKDKFVARARAGYAGVNEGFTGTLIGAGRGETLEWLWGYTRTGASELDNHGDVNTVATNRTEPNPQDLRDRGLLAKLLLKPAAGHKVALALEGRDQDVDIQVLRLSSTLPKVTATSGDDHGRRVRGSLEWEHKPGSGFYDRATVRLYRQDSDTANFNRQVRSDTSATCSASFGSGNNCAVEQDFFFEQTATGGGVQLEKAVSASHFLTFGADLSRLRTEELRDARVRNLTTGAFFKSLAGDNFPVRDFATGVTDTVGAFVQDEIAGLAGGRLSLTPGLRYDRRRLKPEVDVLAQAVLTANGKQAVSQTDSAISPKLAALWQISPALAGYGQIVRGFRAPNYEEVNGTFRNPIQNYGISPNPSLKPETSTGVEVGLRLNRAGVRGQIAVFDNRYQDFIERVRLACPGNPNCIAGLGTTFMSVNLSKVRIYGAEVRGGWDFTPGWRLEGALAYARGTNEDSGQPLNSIEPARLSVALSRDAGAWGAEGRLRAATDKDRVDVTGGVWFRPPGYGVVDLSAWWKPAKQARLVLAVNNLFDRKYWLWSDIRQADSRDPAGVDFYSQPGRHVAASFEYQF